MKKLHTSMAWTLLLLLVGYSSDWSVLCAPCASSAQEMSCRVSQVDGMAFAEACCCGEMVCGEAEESAPVLPTVELVTELSLAPALVVLPFAPRQLAIPPVVALEYVDRSPPLFRLYCSLLI